MTRGVRGVGKKSGEENGESLVVVSGEEEEENHGECEEAAALQAQFRID